jgi:hypothetical protein
MDIRLFTEDLRPESKDKPSTEIDYDDLNTDAQAAVTIVGFGIFGWDENARKIMAKRRLQFNYLVG